MQKNGKLIVIEGLDGSGKGTLSSMLLREMKSRGRKVRKISFPMYHTPGAAPVEVYLSGGLGSRPEDTGPFAASTLYAVDRYLSYRTDWGKFLEDPEALVIADRYTTSNAVHQLSKLPEAQWESFLTWLFDFEYGKLGLPAPDATFYIELPPSLSRDLIAARAAAGRGEDIHEKAEDHLERAYGAAKYTARRCGWLLVPNHTGEALRPLEETFGELLQKLEPFLPAERQP